MSDNKFILQLKGTQTPKSVVEIKNDKLVAPFVNVPGSSDVVGSIIPDKDSSVVVAKGAENWQLDGGALVPATNLTGNGADFTGEYAVCGNMLWVNSTYTFSDTKIFTPNTKWVLQLCGKNLNAGNGNTIDFSFIIKIGSSHIMTKTVTVSEQANFFCKRFVLDFSESEQSIIKAQGGANLTVQLLCADDSASATIYNGMTTLTALQRRVDGEVVASESHTFEDLEVEIAEIQDDIADINGKIIVRSATIPTASADLVGKVYQYSGTTNGIYTHNYIYECQEVETNSYGWVRVDVQPDRITQIQALQADITDIQALIPAQATPQNQLGDKNFINSSIATNTANFIGTFNSVAELEAYTGTVTNNDYAFVVGTDSVGNTTYNRYKYNANTQQWIYEYTLNNSSFTADQWTAINSGVTASDVSKARSAVQPSDVGNGTITITQGGTTMGSFTTNQGNDTTIALDAGGGSGALVIGQILEVTGTADYTPEGCLLTDGAEYTKAQFPDLWADFLTGTPKLQTCTYTEYANQIAEYGFCNKFAVDTTNETFKVPTRNKYRKLVKKIVNGTTWADLYDDGWVEQGGVSGGLNTVVTLPVEMADTNYTLVCSGIYESRTNTQSASWSGTSGNRTSTTTITLGNSVGFPTMGWQVSGYASTIPDSTSNITREFVVVANGTLNQEQMDWSAWASSLAGRATTDMNNITSTGKDAVVGWGSPDYSSGVTASLPYTATSQGFINIYVDGSSQQSTISVNGIVVAHFGGSSAQHNTLFIPINPGDVVSLTAVAGSPTVSFSNFYPCAK